MKGPTYTQVERVEGLSAQEFRDLYDRRTKPVVITGALSEWKALSQWSHEWFKQHYGTKVVSLSANPRHTEKVAKMRLADYVDHIQAGTDGGLYMNQYPIQEFPGLSDYYLVPPYCNPDRWVDVVLWLGPAGTALAFHKDNHNPYDWINNVFVQIVGRKRVVLAAPDQDSFMYQRTRERTDFWYSHIDDPDDVDLSKYPLFRNATLQETTVQCGEILFIPATYWHHVRALDKSISMSFWWRRHRISDLISRFLTKTNTSEERAAFLETYRATITTADVEEFGGIGQLSDALDSLREHASPVWGLFEPSVRAEITRRTALGAK